MKLGVEVDLDPGHNGRFYPPELPLPWKIWTSHVTRDAFGLSALPSNRRHRSNDDCLEGKAEIIRSVLGNIVCNNCAQCNAHTHI